MGACIIKQDSRKEPKSNLGIFPVSLLEPAVEDIVNQHIEKINILIQETAGNALQKIEALIEASNKVAAPIVLEKLHERGNEAMHTRLLVATLMKQAPIYAKLIQQGCEEGLFQTNFPLECAEFILSAIQFLTDLGISPWTEEDLIRRKKAFPKLIEQMLQAPPNSFQFMLKNTCNDKNMNFYD